MMAASALAQATGIGYGHTVQVLAVQSFDTGAAAGYFRPNRHGLS
jgi:hypothetical protein